MIFKFSYHTLEQTNDGYIVTLYMDTDSDEFSNELDDQNPTLSNNMLNRSIMIYIKKYLPDLKINLIKVMIGGVLILTTTVQALELSLKPVYASNNFTSEQISEIASNSTTNIVLNNKVLSLPQKPFILDGISYAPIREISEALGAKVIWDKSYNHVEIVKDDINLSFQIGETSCLLNNIYMTMPISLIVNDKTMVPIRFLSEVFNFNVFWNDNLKTIIISSTSNIPTDEELEILIYSHTKNNNQNYTKEDVYWLSRLVHAEARDESYEGKLAVANVIINRVKSNEFPNSIKSVIFDRNNGVQFVPTVNGEIYKSPSAESERAAIEALNGKNNAQNIFYFLNPKKSPYNWITKNRKYAFTIQNHNFYF